MIEFQGYLSGAAEAFFYKKSIQYGRNFMIILMLFALPPVGAIILIFKKPSIVFAYFAIAIATQLMARFKIYKDRRKINPNKIYIVNDTLVSICEEIKTCKFSEDVKEVRDYGEFYYIVFRLNSPSEKYVCQKNLLTKGTLEEFEALFEGKIVNGQTA